MKDVDRSRRDLFSLIAKPITFYLLLINSSIEKRAREREMH